MIVTPERLLKLCDSTMIYILIIPILCVWPARWIWTAMERDTSRVYDVITIDYCPVVRVSSTSYLIRPDYRVIAVCTTAGRKRSWTAQPNRDTASVFVCNQLCCWTSSWTWSRFHVVLKLLNNDRFQSVLGHNVVEVWRRMSRPRRVCRHSVIMRVVSVVVRLSSRPIVDGLLIAVGHSVSTGVTLLHTSIEPWVWWLSDAIVMNLSLSCSITSCRQIQTTMHCCCCSNKFLGLGSFLGHMARCLCMRSSLRDCWCYQLTDPLSVTTRKVASSDAFLVSYYSHYFQKVPSVPNF